MCCDFKHIHGVQNVNTIQLMKEYVQCEASDMYEKREKQWLIKFFNNLVDDYYYSKYEKNIEQIHLLNGLIHDIHPYDIGEYSRFVWEFCTDNPPQCDRTFRNYSFSDKSMLHNIKRIECMDVVVDLGGMDLLNQIFEG